MYTIKGLPTPINGGKLYHFLQDYNTMLANLLRHWFIQDYNIPFVGVFPVGISNNLRSRVEFPQIVQEELGGKMFLVRLA